MKLSRISATALKGQSFSHDLADITLFIGRNNTGKTARADAIRLALIGHLPELGKTNAATMALASAKKMTIGAELETGAVNREWTQNGKAVKYLASGIEGLPETPLVMLNAAEYFGKSDAGRVQMLFDVMRLDASEWSIDKVRSNIVEHAGSAAAVHLPGTLGGVGIEVEREGVQSWLEKTAIALIEEKKLADQEVRRFEQTAQGLTSIALGDEQVDASGVALDMEAAVTRLGELQGELGKLQQQAEQQQQQAERASTLRGTIATLRAELGERPISETATALKTRLEKLIGERAKLREQQEQAERDVFAMLKKRDRAKVLREFITAAERTTAHCGKSAADLESLTAELAEIPEVNALKLDKAARAATEAAINAKNALATNSDRKVSIEEEFRAALEMPCCPTCGRKGTAWKTAMERNREVALDALEEERGKLLAELFEATEKEKLKADKALAQARKQNEKRQNLAAKIAEARLAYQAAQQAETRLADYRRELAEIGDPEAPVRDFTPELQETVRAIEAAQAEQRRLELAQKIAAAQEQLENIAPGEDDAGERAAMLEDNITAQQARIEDLKALQQKAANQAADARRLAQANQEKETAKARSEALAAMRKAVADIRAELIGATFGPLLEKVNRFTAGILPSPLEYYENELGRFEGANWVPVRCFGGCHMAVTYAGIQAALGASAPAKLVLIDEVDRMDDENKRRFFNNVVSAIDAGVIDQCVACGVRGDWCESADPENPRLRIIRVGACASSA